MSTLTENKKKKTAIRGLGAALVGFAGWVVLLLVFGMIDPNILKINNILNLLRSMAKYLLVGVGQGVILITGNIDLSIGSVVAMSAMISATMMSKGISAIIAIVQYNSNVTFIAQLMGISWGALAGAFLAPFLFGLYWKRATAAGVWASFIFSTVVMLLNMVAKQLFPPLLQSPINAGVFCMIAGFIIVPAVSLLSKAPEKEYVENVFSCYDKKVLVSASDAIGEPVTKEEAK